jgi:hypothetical protein
MSAPSTPPTAAPGDYRARLAAALPQYQRATGRRPAPASLDMARPEVRRAYRAFGQAALRMPFRAALGEELALRLGLKPVLRLLTDPSGVDQLAAHFGRDGLPTLATTTLRRESSVDGLFVTGRAPGSDPRVLFYAGRSAAEVEEAAALDSEIVDSSPLHLALRPWRLWRSGKVTRRLGALLGYPACCVEAFCALGRVPDNATPIAAAAARSVRFDPLLDNVSLSICHLIGWFPCRYDCPASAAVAQSVLAGLAEQDADGARTLHRYLAMPRLYADDRRQIIFDGELVAPGRVRYRAVHTPYAFDRSGTDAAYEWLFFADVVAPLLGGEELLVTSDELVVTGAGGAPRRLPRPAGSTWLPFAAPV